MKNTIIKYLINFDKTLSDISNKMPKELLEASTIKRKDVMMKESNMRTQDLGKVCNPLSKEDITKIVKVLNTRFRTKERVNFIMGSYLDDLQMIIRQT